MTIQSNPSHPCHTEAWTTKWHLVNFQGFFYKHQAIKSQSIILEHGEDFLKSAPFSPLITHISHDGSGSKQVDPLKTLYKRDLTLSAYVTFYYSSTHCPCVLERKTDLTIKRSLVGSPWSPLTVIFFLFRSSYSHCNLEHLTYWFPCIISSYTFIFILSMYRRCLFYC